MNETMEKKSGATAEIEEKKGSQNKLEAYLQGPRKKRKNYVIFALGESFDKAIGQSMEAFVRKTYPQLALSSAKNVEELVRQFGRNISLLIVNDNFAPRDEIMNIIGSMREKRRDETIPVLFMTKDPEALIESYHRKLLLYRESDEYIAYPQSNLAQIVSKLKNGIDSKNRRKSRRYPVSLPLTYFHLNKDLIEEGRLIDLSLHGALLQAKDNQIFKLGDQIKLSIPTNGLVHLETGDFIRISGRVRRVFISGNQVAVSFEHVTDNQQKLIGELLLAIVGRNFAGQTNKLKLQGPPNPAQAARPKEKV